MGSVIGVAIFPCAHCSKNCDGTVVFTRAGFVHITCLGAFKRSEKFRQLMAGDPKLMMGEDRCNNCGGGCKATCWMDQR